MNTKRLLSLALSAVLCLSLAAPAFAMAPPPARDPIAPVPEWYTEAQTFVTENGLMTGTDQGFEPNGTVTRAMLYQTLWNKEGQPAAQGDSFEDVPDGIWYAASAAWAKETGLAMGDDAGHYSGDRAITRAEVATIICRYEDGKAEGSSSITSVPDYDSIPSYALEGMQYCYDAGYMNGDQTGALNPRANLDRASLAQLLFNIYGKKQTPEATPVSGKATAISKYGNVTTDITVKAFEEAGFEVGDIVTVTIGETTVQAPYGTGYSNVDNGKEIIVPDGDYIAVAINMGNFATTYKVEEGTELSFAMGEKAGYLEEYEIRNIDSKRTNNREDYASDEVFANFREVSLGDIGEGVLYRSSNPVNPELGRSTYADDLIKKAGVKTAINLADSKEVMEGYEGYSKSYYSTIDVIPLNMGVDFAAEEFNDKLAEGLTFLTEHDGPYLIHCTEGKDRAGFVCALLEALMGASADEIIEDYMLTYENYYFVEKDSTQYERIAESNIVNSLRSIAGLEEGAELEGVDLAEAAENYLTDTVGLSAKTLTALQTALKG